MGLSTFPLASSGGVTQTFTAATANTLYYVYPTMSAGTYTISCVSSTNATLDFYSGNNLVTSAVTVSGSVLVNLSQTITKIAYYTNTGSNIVISAALTGQSISPTSGTLNTFTTSQTVSLSGNGYAILIGGGGNGGSSWANGSNTPAPGGGGSSGAITFGRIQLTGSTALSIGAGGGGTTTLGALSAVGGNVGQYGLSGGAGGAAPTNGGAGGAANVNGSASTNVNTLSPLFTSGTTGGGGGGVSYAGSPPRKTGGGSGYGTGGTGGGVAGGASGGTGYGAGGGGGGNSSLSNSQGGAGGSAGVCYVIV